MGDDAVMRAVIASKKAKRAHGFKTSGQDKSDMRKAREMVRDFVKWMEGRPRGKTYKAIDPERDANARLIAAAPDMKAALIGIIDMAEHAGFGPDSPIILTARAAIAKATGASQ